MSPRKDLKKKKKDPLREAAENNSVAAIEKNWKTSSQKSPQTKPGSDVTLKLSVHKKCNHSAEQRPHLLPVLLGHFHHLGDGRHSFQMPTCIAVGTWVKGSALKSFKLLSHHLSIVHRSYYQTWRICRASPLTSFHHEVKLIRKITNHIFF